MLKNSNERIKNLYNKKCHNHNGQCIILDELNENSDIKNIKYLHILNADYINLKHLYDNLPDTLEFLEIFNLNFNLLNLPINLKKLFVISFQQFEIKVPFGCEFQERIMNYKPLPWYEEIGKNIISSFELSIGGMVVDKVDYDNNDPNSHTGKTLNKRIKKIYKLSNYEI